MAQCKASQICHNESPQIYANENEKQNKETKEAEGREHFNTIGRKEGMTEGSFVERSSTH
jgi:hypothetical protein